MALDALEVRFFEIDDSQSASGPRSKGYQIMEPLATGSVLDSKNSNYNMDIIPGSEFNSLHIKKLVIYPNAAPVHDLFYDDFFSSILLCTDRFAARVLKAGCKGMIFSDPSGYGGGLRLCRTSRGIERLVGRRPEDYVEITELIKAIP